ncbi:retrotransposon protein, putative, ty1-copia subclass [Tanacetum coccineum]
MSINLTTNAIPKIMAGDLNQKPLLQILDITPIGHAKERYRIVLSDSTTFQTGMIATQCNQLARNGLVRKGFVVQLIDYIYLGEAAYILGIKIYRDRSQRLIGLCQSAYIEKILKGFRMENSKHGSIPMQENPRLSKSEDASTPAELKHMQNVPYASSVGSIMYAVRCTRPDVAFAQNITSRFQQNPGGDLKRELRISCYTNAGYLTDADDLKSQTGYVFVLNGGAVDWKSAKQSIFATSSAEAEYIAAYDASKEAVWVRKFIFGLGVVPTIEEPINMYCDNTGAIAIAKESGITKGARHFRAKVHYLREVIEFGDIKLEKVHTDDNLADPFTKALAFPKHSEHTRNIGMLPASSLM